LFFYCNFYFYVCIIILYGLKYKERLFIMKKFITLLLSVFLLTNTAIASDDITSLREDVSKGLNSTVKTLKEYFKKTDTELKEKKVIVEDAKEKAYVLKEASEVKETNPVVLKQGTASMPNCAVNEELQWGGSSWTCLVPSYGTDCNPAKDEYKYYVGDKAVCAKTPQGQSINYYWKFRGYYPNCGSDAKRARIYGCYYTNKLGAEVEVSDSNCSGASKPSVAEYTCYANWQTGGWGSCSKSCGSGTKTRSVTCAANHICTGSKPSTSQSCNAGSCNSGGSDRDRGGSSGGGTYGGNSNSSHGDSAGGGRGFK
jgi:hypothetical protein